ncbi:MAG: hypothetical protein CL969_00185 [Euryarchaeota archaeon]|jgi:hypothetical protein|nr:hypothetical protein [Euryarchaeota archaeon]MDP6575187.1 hypothetical protein [Candidatus Peribacteraceae bacterium]HCI03298.1 hypothetical protein [Candidatus Peribacteria bacterium]|tara:strand:+ start:370 stop:774 length:405 start_codon:yes stop_codon:yes gene_type:complete
MNPLSLPLAKRKFFCIGASLLASIAVAFTLPAELIEKVPMVQAGMIINGLVIGTMLTFVGVFTWHPVFKFRMHPIFRGALIAAFVHLDYTIYTWSDQPLFWKTMIIAAVFGAVIDQMATQLYGEGDKLLKGMNK